MQSMPSNFSSYSDYAQRERSSQRMNDTPHPADAELAASLRRLHELRMAALAGGHYDADEFDDAVLAFRRAWDDSQDSAVPDRRRVA